MLCFVVTESRRKRPEYERSVGVNTRRSRKELSQGRVNLLRRIRSNTDTLSAERIYRAMIMPIFTYCGQITLGWSEARRCQIRNLEQRSHRIILQNSKCLNCELRLSSIENFLKKKASLFVFDCLKGNVCSPFKNYFNLLIHDFNTVSYTHLTLPTKRIV